MISDVIIILITFEIVGMSEFDQMEREEYEQDKALDGVPRISTS